MSGSLKRHLKDLDLLWMALPLTWSAEPGTQSVGLGRSQMDFLLPAQPRTLPSLAEIKLNPQAKQQQNLDHKSRKILVLMGGRTQRII